jgi:hypothetical protein
LTVSGVFPLKRWTTTMSPGGTDGLLHQAAVGPDHAARDGLSAAPQGVDELGVVALAQRREADEVANGRALFSAARI